VYALDYPQCAEDENWGLESKPFDRMLNSDRFMKNAHLHRAARKSMRKVLDSPNYDSLMMGMHREDLQKFHDQIQTRLTTKKTQSVLQSHTMNIHNDGTHERGKHGETLDEDSDLDFGFESADHDDDQSEKSEDVSEFDANTYDECIMHYMDEYLNRDDVQSALKVKPTEWGVCSDVVWNSWPESDFSAQIEPYYTEIVENWLEEQDLTLVIYSGDDDSVCGLQGTMYWLDRWGYDVNNKVEWEMWSDADNQLGGYYTQYMDNSGNTALHFLTVRSAGHMVPTTQPGRALSVLQKFLYEFQEDKEKRRRQQTRQ